MMPLKRRIRKMFERTFVSSGLSIVLALIRLTPYKTALRMANGVAWLARALVPSRQRMAAANMRVVFGERYQPDEYRTMAYRATRNLFLTMMELLKLRDLPKQTVLSMVSIEGIERLQRAFEQGKGVILITGHLGAWEVMGARLVMEGVRLTVLGTFSSRAARAINGFRTAMGVRVIDPKDVRGMLSVLHGNGCVGILPDLRFAASNSIEVDFLGRPALTAVGTATIALRTGSPVLPTFCRRLNDGTFVIKVQPALELSNTGDRQQDIRRNTELFNRVISDQIMESPDQWYWLHDRWKPRPAAKKLEVRS